MTFDRAWLLDTCLQWLNILLLAAIAVLIALAFTALVRYLRRTRKGGEAEYDKRYQEIEDHGGDDKGNS